MLRIKFFEAKDEPERKKQSTQSASSKPVKDKEVNDFDDSIFKTQKEQPVAKVDRPADNKSSTPSSEKPKTGSPEIKKASAADTAKAMRGVNATDDMRDMMSRINVPDEMIANEPELDTDNVPSDEVRPEPVNPNNVPAMISREIAAAMPNSVDPQFHQVKNLPGYMSRAIRAMGRETFKNYTDTPIDDISVIANLGGQGPNSEREINAVSSWLKQNGTKLDASELGFGDMIPGYSAQTMLFSTAGMRFLVVKDFAGGYIYVWPEASSNNILGSDKGSAKALAAPDDSDSGDDLADLMAKYGL